MNPLDKRISSSRRTPVKQRQASSNESLYRFNRWRKQHVGRDLVLSLLLAPDRAQAIESLETHNAETAIACRAAHPAGCPTTDRAEQMFPP